jgi:hypothetical protein
LPHGPSVSLFGKTSPQATPMAVKATHREALFAIVE